MKKIIITALLIPVLLLALEQYVSFRIREHEKISDKNHEVVTTVFTIPADYYQKMWNLYFAINSNSTEDVKEYRDKIQSTVVEAKAVTAKLLLFENKNIVNEWNKFLSVYQGAFYKLTRSGLTEKELNKRLNEAQSHMSIVVQEVYKELGHSVN